MRCCSTTSPPCRLRTGGWERRHRSLVTARTIPVLPAVARATFEAGRGEQAVPAIVGTGWQRFWSREPPLGRGHPRAARRSDAVGARAGGDAVHAVARRRQAREPRPRCRRPHRSCSTGRFAGSGASVRRPAPWYVSLNRARLPESKAAVIERLPSERSNARGVETELVVGTAPRAEPARRRARRWDGRRRSATTTSSPGGTARAVDGSAVHLT